MSPQQYRDDVFIAPTDHTAIPDWLALRRDIPMEARDLAHVILVLAKGTLLPTRDELAQAIGVDVRTIERRLSAMRECGILRTYRAGRRNFFILHDSTFAQIPDTCDHRSHGSPIHVITDPMCRVSCNNPEHSSAQQEAENGDFFENPITDPPVGVVGDHDSLEQKKPTPTTRAPLKTTLGRWLKQAGMNAARQFDDSALDYWTYRRFVETKRAAGWEWRQIVSTLRDAPLEPDPHAAPLDLPDAAGDELAAPAPAGRSIEEAQARWEARRSGRL